MANGYCSRSSFFRPPALAGMVWLISMCALLIPTSMILAPLGTKKRGEENESEQAQKEYNAILFNFNDLEKLIQEARDRVNNLNCAIAGYESFNQQINLFKEKLENFTAEPTDLLKTLWKLQFSEDKKDIVETDTAKQFNDHKQVCDLYTYSHYSPQCHLVSFTNSYVEHRIVTNNYKNIITGQSWLPALHCGYYSREFQIQAQTYATYAGPVQESGSMKASNLYLNYYNELGSRVVIQWTLDGTTQTYTLVVPRSTSQQNAAETIADSLYPLLITAIASFKVPNTTYYLSTQSSIRDSIPALLDQIPPLKASISEKRKNLDNENTELVGADDEFNNALKLWLPIFFLAPIGLSVATYFIAKCCEKTPDDKQVAGDDEEREPVIKISP